MTEARPIRVSMREVVAAGAAFRDVGVAYEDPGVALDEISSLRASQEPMVLRVAADGMSLDRSLLRGDWLCDSDGSEPRRIRCPPWEHDRESARWSRFRPLIDVWEACENPRWLMSFLSQSAGGRGRRVPDPSLARRLVSAACACAEHAARTLRGRGVKSAVRKACVAGADWASGGEDEALVVAWRAASAERDRVEDSASVYALSAAVVALELSRVRGMAFRPPEAASFAILSMSMSDPGSRLGDIEVGLCDAIRAAVPAIVVLRRWAS